MSPVGVADASAATTRGLWLDPSFGASGDMLLGALLGLAPDPDAALDAVLADLATLAVDGWSVNLEPVVRAGIDATRAVVTTAEGGHAHRAWSTIDAMLADAPLPAAVADGARRTFERLGRAEAAIHRVDLDEVQFHEVGAVDAIVDIVGVWSALHQLGVDDVTAGPIGLGHGHVTAAHGRLPTPAPATAAILRGAPVHSLDVGMETVTPTGAALLAAMASAWGPIPSGRLGPVARGAGGRNPDGHPNVVTALLIEGPFDASAPPTDPELRATTAEVLATNLDDATPELIAHTIELLLAAGADDAWVVPMVMKKGRPAHELRVLCGPERSDDLRRLLVTETGTLGVRTQTVTKHVANREMRHVEIRGHRIGIKVGPRHRKPEFDDLRAAADATGIPLKQLAEEALAADSSVGHVTFDRE
ncbi:MAG: nickel pincer cofactor biosynthesis protein LarC [Actinomycetota bacterium]